MNTEKKEVEISSFESIIKKYELVPVMVILDKGDGNGNKLERQLFVDPQQLPEKFDTSSTLNINDYHGISVDEYNNPMDNLDVCKIRQGGEVLHTLNSYNRKEYLTTIDTILSDKIGKGQEIKKLEAEKTQKERDELESMMERYNFTKITKEKSTQFTLHDTLHDEHKASDKSDALITVTPTGNSKYTITTATDIQECNTLQNLEQAIKNKLRIED